MTAKPLILAAVSMLIPAVAAAQAPAGAQAESAPAAPAETGTSTAAVAVATKADVVAGATVLDPKGGTVGKIEAVTANGAVISTGTARAEIPFASFGKNDKGLVIGMTKAELEAAAKGS